VAESKDDSLVKSVESLLADKQALVAREKKLIDDLNSALGKMGYKVVPTAAKKPGRPPGSGKAQPPKTGASS